MRALILMMLIAASLPASAQTYRWTDPVTGKTVISDNPPPPNAKKVSKAGEAPVAADGLSFAARQAAEKFPVTLYTAPDCLAECKNARELLNRRGVPFAEKMVQKQEDIEEIKQLVGDAFVPVFKVGRQSVRGFQAESYNNLLDLAGYPQTAAIGAKPSGGLSQ